MATPEARSWSDAFADFSRKAGGATAALVLVVGLGAILRLHDIGDRSFSHPENFVPGFPVPDWTTFPPSRPDLRAVLVTTLEDGHPPTYFVALIPWIRAFGTSEASYRIPSALLGVLSILLVFRIARRELSSSWALLPAALLALHGFHVFWSQLARPYAASTFLGLLATLFLLRTLERGRGGDAAGLFASTLLGLATQLYLWPLTFAQMIVAALREWGERGTLRALRVQLAAVIVAAPIAALAVVQNPPTGWSDPRLDYFELGFAFLRNARFWGNAPATFVPRSLLLAATVALLALAMIRAFRRVADPPPPIAPRPHWIATWLLSDLALLSAAAMLALYVANGATRLTVLASCGFPLALVALAHGMQAIVEPRLRPASAPRRLAAPLALWLALLPPALMLAVSAVRPSWVARGALAYVPYLLIAVATGAAALARQRLLAALVVAFLLTASASSLRYFAEAESGPRDYRGLALQLVPRLAADDAIFVHRESYSYPPLFYYMPEHLHQLVPGDWAAFVAREQPARVWLVSFARVKADVVAGMRAALSEYREVETHRAHEGEAILFERLESARANAARTD